MFPCKFLFWSARKLLRCHFQLLNRQTHCIIFMYQLKHGFLVIPGSTLLQFCHIWSACTCMCKSTIITHLCVNSLVPRLFFIRAMGEPGNEAKCKSHTTSVELKPVFPSDRKCKILHVLEKRDFVSQSINCDIIHSIAFTVLTCSMVQ